jgi:hypothetical protein
MDDRQSGRKPAGEHDDEELTDEQIIAAVGRAIKHGATEHDAAPVWAVLAHLAIARRSSRARVVRRQISELERVGALERDTAHGVTVWRLTRAGARRLEAAERLPQLPESPQHARWRNARVVAEQELGRFAAELASALEQGREMLAALGGDAPHSDAWLRLAARLDTASRRVGSAWHCLHEWPEPDDAHPDRDEADSRSLSMLRAGRRNVLLWREAEPESDP